MPRALRALFVIFALAPWGGSLAAEAKPLLFGLLPNLSTRALMATYQPMHDFLEKELGRPVEVVTAANFNAFIQRVLVKDYDLLVAAPHLARLAQTEANYQLLARYDRPLQAFVVVDKDSTIRGLKDLAGKRLASPDKTAIVSMLVQDMLAQAGMRPGVDYQVFDAKSHNNAALSVVNAQADAGVIGSIPFARLDDEVRGRLRIVAKSKYVPGQYFAASDRLSSQERKRIERALIKFVQTAEGKVFLEQFAMHDIVKIKSADLKEMDSYARRARQLLTEPVPH